MLHLTMSNSTCLHNPCLCHLASLSILTKPKPGHHPRLVLAGPRGMWVVPD